MPLAEHELIELLRVRAAKEGRNTGKSEIVRAGLAALMGLKPEQLTTLLNGLQKVKPGRR
jgi:plasmid stability protein